METRRSFISKAGKGTAYAALAASPAAVLGAHGSTDPQETPLRIGIIGAENTHTAGFGRLFNEQKKFPGVEVTHVWGETDEFARNAAVKGKIPNIVKDPLEMLGKIDALIVDHRHPKYHLEAATPFVKEGVPAFIDKPFCYRVAEGREFLEMAREVGTPVTSYSSIAQSAGTFNMTDQVKSMEKINQVVRFGPVDLDSPYGGVFFYGVHSVQPLLHIFGEDVEKVKVSRETGNGNATMVFGSGLFATLVFKKISRGWNTFVETEDGLKELLPRVDEPDPALSDSDMVRMFRTGHEPRSHESILKCVAVLEALERSASSQKWERVLV